MTSSLKLTWLAINQIVADSGNRVISFSCRQIAEATCVGKSTANKNIKKLMESGHLTLVRVSRHGSGLAPTYQVHQNGTLKVFNDNAKKNSSVHICDAFASQPSLPLIFSALVANDGATTTELATAVGVHRNTIYRAMKRLIIMGLVNKIGYKHYLTYLPLEDAAERIGATGLLAEKKAQHKRDRLTYKETIMSNVIAVNVKINPTQVRETTHCYFYNNVTVPSGKRISLQVFKTDTQLLDLMDSLNGASVLHVWIRPGKPNTDTYVLDDAMTRDDIYNLLPETWEQSPTWRNEIDAFESDRKALVYA